tara:strand:- start:170 stop:475 length:306 start_codon:yes stop_codon:yes gene_type:complete
MTIEKLVNEIYWEIIDKNKDFGEWYKSAWSDAYLETKTFEVCGYKIHLEQATGYGDFCSAQDLEDTEETYSKWLEDAFFDEYDEEAIKEEIAKQIKGQQSD